MAAVRAWPRVLLRNTAVCPPAVAIWRRLSSSIPTAMAADEAKAEHAYSVAYVTAPVGEAPTLASKIVDARLGMCKHMTLLWPRAFFSRRRAQLHV